MKQKEKHPLPYGLGSGVVLFLEAEDRVEFKTESVQNSWFCLVFAPI